MDESRRLAMRRAHARRAYYCTCGKIVYGNGGYAAHQSMHLRKGDWKWRGRAIAAPDGHFYMTQSEYERRQKLALS